MDAFVAVLLSQPLRLTHLLLGSDFMKETHIIGLVLRSGLCTPLDSGLRLGLANLKTVSFERQFSYFEEYDHSNTADLLPLFYLPSVERILVTIDNPVTFSWPAARPPTCSSLHSLELIYI